MPRDKSLSHEKVKRAIKEEFLEKGYEDASIRSIGTRAGMTSADTMLIRKQCLMPWWSLLSKA